MKKWLIFFIIVIGCIVIFAVPCLSYFSKINSNDNTIDINLEMAVTEKKSITISAVGDCTIGSDPNFGYTNSFHQVYDNNTPDYFFKEVSSLLQNDDITFANFESTFTDAMEKEPKAFNFKAPKEYVDILKTGSVEVVSVANNHTYDFKEQGFNDTINTLEEADISYCGAELYSIYEVKGIKVGFIGYYANYNPDIYEEVEAGLKTLKEKNVDLIIVSYHWGVEKTYEQNTAQKNLGRWTIDNGADLVIGHGPHVIQGIEKYNDKYIIYSLANFVFGGNKNPNDKDSFVFQQTFNFENDELVSESINIVPVSVSSKKNINDYQPTILEGDEKTRVLNKIIKYSENVVLLIIS